MCLVFSRSLLFLSVPFLLAMVFSLLFRFTASDYSFGIFNLLSLDDTHTYIFIYIYMLWNLSHPTHKGTREMCRVVQDVRILRFYFS